MKSEAALNSGAALNSRKTKVFRGDCQRSNANSLEITRFLVCATGGKGDSSAISMGSWRETLKGPNARDAVVTLKSDDDNGTVGSESSSSRSS